MYVEIGRERKARLDELRRRQGVPLGVILERMLDDYFAEPADPETGLPRWADRLSGGQRLDWDADHLTAA